MKRTKTLTIFSLMAALFLSLAAVTGVYSVKIAKAEETVYTWPSQGMSVITDTGWCGNAYIGDVAIKVQTTDATLYGPDSSGLLINPKVNVNKTNADVETLKKVTYTRGGETITAHSLAHLGNGVIFGFDGSESTVLSKTPMVGDVFAVTEDFTFTLLANKEKSWQNRTFKFQKALSYTYTKSGWVDTDLTKPADVYNWFVQGANVITDTGYSGNPYYGDVVVKVETTDKTLWGPDASGLIINTDPKINVNKTNADVETLKKVTYKRGNVTIAAHSLGHLGKGVMYGFNSVEGTVLTKNPQDGDVFTISEDFAFTLLTNKDNTWTNRKFKYTTALNYTYSGGQWVDLSVADFSSDPVFTYITAPEVFTEKNSEGRDIKLVKFGMNLSTVFNGSVADDSLLKAIEIDEKSLFNIMKTNAARYEISANMLNITVAGFDMNGHHTLSVKKGATAVVVGGKKLLTRDDETFKYDPELQRWDLVPDFDEIKKNGNFVSVEIVEMSVSASADPEDPSKLPYDGFQTKDDQFQSVWVTFDAAVNDYSIGQMQSSLETLVSGRKPSVTSDLQNYGYAKNGAFASVTDKLFVNGKSIREWMREDYKNGDGELIRVAYFGFNLWDSSAKTMVIVAANSSVLGKTMGVGKAMTIELKEGFTTPNMLCMGKDMKFRISAENAKGNQSRFDNVDSFEQKEPEVTPPSEDANNEAAENEKPSEGGCSGSVCGGMPIACVAALSIVAVIKTVKKGRKEDDYV